MQDATVTYPAIAPDPVGRITWPPAETPPADAEAGSLQRDSFSSAEILRSIWATAACTQITTRYHVEEGATSSQYKEALDCLRQWFVAKQGFKEAVSTLAEELVARYIQFDQVHSIYLLDTPELIDATIFLDQPNYDKKLMHKLFHEEARIMREYRHKLFDFHYFPLLESRDFLPVSPEATLVWSKS